ncbi:MAG: 16S rRNA (uracil(1498)-N(3))-methyltransferase [Alphaproteobacteria bacterium]
MAFDPSKIRLYVEAALEGGAEVPLSPGQAHYLRAVMRRDIGAQLYLFNGRDGEWTATLSVLSKKAAAVLVNDKVRDQTQTPDLHLCFAPIKGARLDFVAQKATEMGVSVIQPVLTERTIVRRIKTDRLMANAMEAAEQCECMAVPQVQEPLKLDSLLAGWPSDRTLVFCDEGGSRNPLEALQSIGPETQKWGVLIGPEGGFSDAERARILAGRNVLPITLGPRILRADTAAIAALSLVQAVLGDWEDAPRQARLKG